MKSLAGRAKVLGTVICVGGAVLLTFYKGKALTHEEGATSRANTMNSSKKTESWTIGSIFLIAGVTAWSSWFLIQAKIGKRYPCQYTSTAILSFFGGIQSAILSLIIERKLSGWVLNEKWEFITVIYAVSILVLTSIINIHSKKLKQVGPICECGNRAWWDQGCAIRRRRGVLNRRVQCSLLHFPL